MRTTIICLLVVSVFFQLTQAAPENSQKQKSEESAILYSLVGTLLPSVISIPLISSQSEYQITYSNGLPETTKNSGLNESLGIGLLSAGVVVGPGLGHLYAGNKKSFYKGLAVRTIAGGLFALGITKFELFSDDNKGADILIIAGGSVMLFSIISDISKGDNSVRVYNKANQLTHIQVYPSFTKKEIRLNFALRF